MKRFVIYFSTPSILDAKMYMSAPSLRFAVGDFYRFSPSANVSRIEQVSDDA